MGHEKYQISIERDGRMVPVGSISGESYRTATFSYIEEYLDDRNAVPVSISLPLQRESFSAEQTRRFFEGLLPEGFTRRSVAQWLHLDENDYLSILHQLGRECLGAVRVTAEGEAQSASYEMVTEQQVKALAAEGAQKSAEIVTKSHLSLTGASGKVGLYYDEADNRWYLPEGSASSTHIVKQSHVRLEGIVTNEQLSMMTAAKCGIEVPQSFIIDLGSGNDSEVLYAARRYDRTFEGSVNMITGLPCPLRLHQEDFSQAMGISSADKYEKRNAGYMRRMFETLRQYSSNPIADQQRLWDMIVFNYLLGNTDAHIKNFSLLYGKDLRSIRLAPAYDMVSTTVYESSTREMAFSIGSALSIDDITENSFIEASEEVHLGNMTLYYFKEMGRKTAADYLLESTKPAFILQGAKDFQVLAKRDYRMFKKLLAGRTNTRFKLYPDLNHIFVKGIYDDILKASKEYKVERHIPEEVIRDIAAFIRDA